MKPLPHGIDLVINIPKTSRQEVTDGYLIRRKAIDLNIPLITNTQVAKLWRRHLVDKRDLKIKSWKGMEKNGIFAYLYCVKNLSYYCAFGTRVFSRMSRGYVVPILPMYFVVELGLASGFLG